MSNNIESQSSGEESKNNYGKKTTFKKYLMYVSFAVASIIGYHGIEKTSGVDKGEIISLDLLKPTKENPYFGDNMVVFLKVFNNGAISKEIINELYDQFRKGNFALPIRTYIKNILLKSYLNILENGYSVDGNQELLHLTQKIEYLSDGEITIKGNHQDPNFTQELIFTGTLKENTLQLSVTTPFFNSGVNKGTIKVNGTEFVETLLQGMPGSISTASETIAEISTQLSEAHVQGRQQQAEILQLKNTVVDLEKNISQGVQTHESQTTDLQKAHKDTLTQITTEFEKQIQDLKEEHAKKIAEMKQILADKEQEKQDLVEQHTKEKERLLATYTVQIKRGEDQQNKAISEIQAYYEKQTAKLETEIERLLGEISNNKVLHDTNENTLHEEIKNLGAQIQQYIAQLAALNNQNNELINTNNNGKKLQETLQKELEKKQKEIYKFIAEKQQLTETYNASLAAQGALLTQTQDSLSRATAMNDDSKKENSRLELQINEGKKEIEKLKEKEKELGELKEQMKDYTEKQEKLQELEEKIAKLTTLNTQLQAEKAQLTTLNTQLQANLKKREDYDQLQSQLKQSQETISGLETQKRELETRVSILHEQNKGLSEAVESGNHNNKNLQTRLNDLRISFEQLKTKAWKLTEDEKNAEYKKMSILNTKLTQQNEELGEDLKKIIKEKEEIKASIDKLTAEHAQKIIEMEKEKERVIARIMAQYLIQSK